MLMYFLIGLSLVLVGIAGLQFAYLFYVDRLYRERRKYLHDLEFRHAQLALRLEAAERRLAEPEDLLDAIYPDLGKRDEAWAEVIDER